MECCGRKRLLMILSSASSCAAFGLLCMSVATDYWLHTMEKIETPSTSANNTSVYICAYSGLFRKCFDTSGSIKCRKPLPDVSSNTKTRGAQQCTYIAYFHQDYDADNLAPGDAILLTIRKATFFPLSSLLILVVGGTVGFVGHCQLRRKVLTFVSGVFFVIAGLCTLVGIILYIGSITGAVGNKPRQQKHNPKFIYYYGSSFMMAVGSFVLAEMAGVFAVYLFIARHNQERRIKKMKRDVSSEYHPGYHYVNSSSRTQYNSYQPNHRQEASTFSNSVSLPGRTYVASTASSDAYSVPRNSSRYNVSTAADTNHVMSNTSVYSANESRRITPV